MRPRDRKSVYLNVRITREMDKKIRQLRRARRHRAISDLARELFEEGVQHAEERGEFAALPVRKRTRSTPPDPAPATTNDVESEPQVAA
jgi:hypothetical protein